MATKAAQLKPCLQLMSTFKDPPSIYLLPNNLTSDVDLCALIAMEKMEALLLQPQLPS